MSVENMGVTSISLFSSRGTPALRHNYVISIGKGRDVWHCLALMAICPKLMLFGAVKDPR